MKWTSDGAWKCGVCDGIFQIYTLNEDEVFSQCGCPICGVVVPPFTKLMDEPKPPKIISDNISIRDIIRR